MAVHRSSRGADKTSSRASGGGSFDLRSWEGLTKTLAAARASRLQPDEYDTFRDLVLTYAQNGGDQKIKSRIDAMIARFNQSSKQNLPTERESEKKEQAQNRAAPQEEGSKKGGSHVIQESKTLSSDSATQKIIVDEKVLSKIAPTTEGSLGGARPVPSFGTSAPKCPIQEEVVEPEETISFIPEAVKRRTPEAGAETPPDLPIGSFLETSVAAVAENIQDDVDTKGLPEEVAPPSAVPEEAHVAVPVSEEASNAPEQNVPEAPVASKQNSAPSAPDTLSAQKDRIMEIKHEVSERIGNPAVLMNTHSETGRVYMAALLGAMKASSGGGAPGALTEAMQKLESAYDALCADPAHQESPQKKVVDQEPVPKEKTAETPENNIPSQDSIREVQVSEEPVSSVLQEMSPAAPVPEEPLPQPTSSPETIETESIQHSEPAPQEKTVSTKIPSPLSEARARLLNATSSENQTTDSETTNETSAETAPTKIPSIDMIDGADTVSEKADSATESVLPPTLPTPTVEKTQQPEAEVAAQPLAPVPPEKKEKKIELNIPSIAETPSVLNRIAAEVPAAPEVIPVKVDVPVASKEKTPPKKSDPVQVAVSSTEDVKEETPKPKSVPLPKKLVTQKSAPTDDTPPAGVALPRIQNTQGDPKNIEPTPVPKETVPQPEPAPTHNTSDLPTPTPEVSRQTPQPAPLKKVPLVSQLRPKEEGVPPKGIQRLNTADLHTEKISTSLEHLLGEWDIFRSSGVLGMGPGGTEHPLYKRLAQLPMSHVMAGRWEKAYPDIRHSIKDYVDSWRHEQGISYIADETFETYLRRVIQRILKRQNRHDGA